MKQRFWVVGGEYADTRFHETAGPATAFGPYPTYNEALRVWREKSVESRPQAHVRFTIAVEAGASTGHPPLRASATMFAGR